MANSEIELGSGLKLVPYRRVALCFKRKEAVSNFSLDEWQLKQTILDLLRKHASYTPEGKDLQIQKERDLQKKVRDHPVASGFLDLVGPFAQNESHLNKIIQSLHNIEIRVTSVKLLSFAMLENSSDWTHFKTLWEERFGLSSDGYVSRRAGERPDTIKIKRIPSRFLAELVVSSKPSVLVTHTMFSFFGPIKNLEVISDDDVAKILKKSSFAQDIKSVDKNFPLLSSFLYCDVVVQYVEHSSFVNAVKGLVGKGMQKSGSNVFSRFDFEIVLENYFDERNVRKRKFEKEKEAREEKREKEEREKKRRIELKRKEYEILEKERLEKEERERKIEEEKQRMIELEKERQMEIERELKRERERERELELEREREREEELRRRKEEMKREIEERIKKEMEEQRRKQREAEEEEAYKRETEGREREGIVDEERKERLRFQKMQRGRREEMEKRGRRDRGEDYFRREEEGDDAKERGNADANADADADAFALYEERKRRMFNTERVRLVRRGEGDEKMERERKDARDEKERRFREESKRKMERKLQNSYSDDYKQDVKKVRNEYKYEKKDDDEEEEEEEEEEEGGDKDDYENEADEPRWVLEETKTYFSNFFNRNLEIHARLLSEGEGSILINKDEEDVEVKRGEVVGLGRLCSEVRTVGS